MRKELRTPFGAVYMYKNGKRISFKAEAFDYGMYLNDGMQKKPQGLYKLYPDMEELKRDDIIICEFDGGQLQSDGGGEFWFNIVGTYQGYTIGMGAPDSQDIEGYDPQRRGILPYETLGNTDRGFKMQIVDIPEKYFTKKVFQNHKLCFIVAWEPGTADEDWELISFVTC